MPASTRFEPRGGGVLVAVGEAGLGAYPLPSKDVVTIGRSADNDVPINEPSISREHAVIHFVGDEVYIEDVGSSNGTHVRDAARWTPDLDVETIAAMDRQLERGERVRLVSGSIILLGAVMLMFQSRGSRGRPRRLWPRALFEERVEEECAHAVRDQRTFAIVHMRVSAATMPTATIDIAKRMVHGHHAQGPQQIAEEVLASATRASDMIAAEENGGEYHILLSPATSRDAEELVDRLESAARQQGLAVDLGYASYPRDGRSTAALLARASKGTAKEDASDLPHQIVVRDPQMLALYQLLDRVAITDVTVLLLGETGVGKEVIAEAIHRKSRRASGPLVRINCAALPETLLEGELFGHERGAFTGADKAKAGLFESARGGTIFLDEIGEIPLSTQVKLLRVLEERKVMRLGARVPTDIDARVVAATNRSLEQEVTEGRFRQDLFFRLNVFPLEIPPLRERTVEIAALATAFIASMCQQMGRQPSPRLSSGAVAALETYAWPGNIRELRNVVHRATLLTQGDVITEAPLPLDRMGRTIGTRVRTDQQPIVPQPSPFAHGRATTDTDARARPRAGRPTLPPQIPTVITTPALAPRGAATPQPSLTDEVDQLERDRIIAALEECAGNQTRAAALLGITRRVLLNRLDRYNIPRPRK